jgi:hypothetical protein
MGRFLTHKCLKWSYTYIFKDFILLLLNRLLKQGLCGIKTSWHDCVLMSYILQIFLN